MSIYKELSYDQYIDVVRGIQFGVLSPEEIERRSVVEVKKTDTYSGTDPIVDGLFDPRMGVLEHSRVCATCEQKNNFCPGHFGHIKLARPVFHAMFFDHIKRLLKCVCYRCSRILVSENSTHVDIRETVKKAQVLKNLEKRNAIMFKLCSNNNKLKKCGDGNPGGCNCRQPNKYYKENALKIMAEWKEQGMQPERKEFTPEDVLRIFQRISEKDMEILGFNPKWNRPEWMICTVLPVPPPSVRPSIIEENGQRREDDLTHKLCDIIKTNNQLKQRIERGNATEEQLRLTSMVLQYHVATFVDNQLPGIPPAQQRNGRRLKSLCDRLKKKEGRIRGNLNGKRVDQSARSVITPDPYISLDELGVPIKVALNLTFPETVNAFNKAHLQKLVRTGPDVWPGAKYVRKASNGNTFSLRLSPEKRDEIAGELHEGDIVDRHLSDGDYVLFNRQPSLHKMSMMCHRVKVMPYNTFRLNVLVTSPYNADFDGDEMNTHCPQSIQTMCELMDFASVPYHTITPKDAQPIIEVVQDTMLGAYRLTKSHVRMTDKVLANLQMVNSYFKGGVPEPEDKDMHLYTGRQAYSMVLPPSLFLKVKNKLNETVTIEDSQITDGIIDKKAYTAMTKGILPVLFHDYGPFEVRRFMDNTQRLICRWLVTSGFSVGISDLVIPDSIHSSIKDRIQEKKLEAYKKIEAVRKGDIANTSMMNNHDFLESEIINILNELNSHIGKTVSDTLDDNLNRLVNMVKSGSKGKPQNVAQMIANVGQQNVDGKRVAYGFTDRTLPHYSKYDDGPEARGFVENSFISGLTPQEVFFHAMGGREGLIDTAVKTSETGYIQRRLVKAMEDAKVYYDQTVRNASGNIVQFIYGEDGMEGTKIEIQSYPVLNMTTYDMEQTYHLRPEDAIERYLSDEGKKTLKKEKKWVSRCAEHYQSILKEREQIIVDVFHKSNDITLYYPIPFSRIIENADKRAKSIGATHFPTDLTPEYVLDSIERLKQSLYVIQDQGIFFLHVLLNVHLSPKVMILKYRFSKSLFDWILSEIERCFHEAVAPPGEMVGIIAAQSMGEPATQLTLDSFHVSGTAAAVKATSGVPRLKELLSVSKNIKTPSLTIYLKKEVGTVVDPIEEENDEGQTMSDPRVSELKDRALHIRNQMEITRLSYLLDSTEIFWDPPGDGFETSIEEDKEMLALYREFSEVAQCYASTSPWVLRMKINKERLHDCGLTMMDVYMKLFEAYSVNVECVFSDDNAEELILRMRLTNEKEKKKTEEEDEEEGEQETGDSEDDAVASLKALEHNMVHNLILKGVSGIKKVSMRSLERKEYSVASGQFHTLKEWIMQTDGSNLLEILCNPNVDASRTVSNDIWEIFQAYGIEAARTALYNEIMDVIRESSVNYRHISLLIDTMTNKGSLMSIDRHGINRGDVGPLAKSSFEETTDMLINAGVFSDYDKINGVSANIMLGQLPPCGTGDSEILIDEEGYLAILKERAQKQKKKSTLPSPVIPDVPEVNVLPPCDISELVFDHKMPKKTRTKMRVDLPDAPF